MSNSIQLRRLKPSDPDLDKIAAELNESDNEISLTTFTAASLKHFLSDPGRFYLIATIDDQIAGAAHGYVLHHPAGAKYLYIDEVDTVKAFRRQGVAKLMMSEAFTIGRELGCSEAWLGTEHDNTAAKALYEDLKPYEVEHGPIYTWKLS